MLKDRLKKFTQNKGGFTLVEMIVAFSLLGVAVMAIGGFIVTGVKSYNKTSAEAQIQEEAQTALNQIENTVIDAGLGVSYNVFYSETDHFCKADGTSIPSAGVDKYLYVFNMHESASEGETEDESIDALLIRWNSDDQKLYYAELSGFASDTISGSLGITKWDLLASGVTAFSCDLSTYDTTGKITVNLTVEKSSRTYATNGVITLRNSVLINAANTTALYERSSKTVTTTITGVTLTSSSDSIVKGGSVQLNTKVKGTGYPSQTIARWTIESVTDSGNVILYDSSNVNKDTDTAYIDADSKVLYLHNQTTPSIVPADVTNIRVTCYLSATHEVSGKTIPWSASKDIAVKDISTFSIWPEPDTSLSVNSTLQVPSSGYATKSTSSTEACGMDVYPCNVILFKGQVVGANLTTDDSAVVWTVTKVDGSLAEAEIVDTGTVTENSVTYATAELRIDQYSQQGNLLVTASPKLNPDMQLTYNVHVGNQYAEGENALQITGGADLVRGGSLQLGLTMNGVKVEKLDDFDWTVSVTSSQGTITGTTASVSSGLVTVSSGLAYAYSYNVTVTAKMKSNPDVNNSITLTVPKVQLTMSPASRKVTPGETIKRTSGTSENSAIKCIVTGLADSEYDLTWTMATETNAKYYRATTTNGSSVTADTYLDSNNKKVNSSIVYISGKEVASYIRVKAALKSDSSYFATSYLFMTDVDLNVTAGTETIARNDSGTGTTLTASFTNGSTKAGDADLNNVQWTIVSAKEKGSTTALSLDGLSLSASKGKSTILTASNDFYLSSTEIEVTVHAEVDGFKKDITIKVSPVSTTGFTLTGNTTIKRGQSGSNSLQLTLNGSSIAGTRDIEWTISSSVSGQNGKYGFVENSQSKTGAKVELAAVYDTANGSSDVLTVRATIKGTGIYAEHEIRVEQVALTVTPGTVSGKSHPFTATVSGFDSSVTDYTVSWGLSTTEDTASSSTELNGMKLNNCTTSGATVDASNATGNVYVYAALNYKDVLWDSDGTNEVMAKTFKSRSTIYNNTYYYYYYTRFNGSTRYKKVTMSVTPPNNDGNMFDFEPQQPQSTSYYNYNINSWKYSDDGVDYYYCRISTYTQGMMGSYYSYNTDVYLAYYNSTWYLIDSNNQTSVITASNTANALFGFDYTGLNGLEICNIIRNKTPEYND